MGYFKHPLAIVETERVGEGTRVWAFAHILPGASIGRDCNICDHTFIENDVVLGDRVTVKCGVFLWDGIRIEDDAFVGANAVFTNDPFPRSKQYLAQPARTIVRRGASIGANATVLPGLTIGESAMVGAGAVVTRNVPANAIAMGNPAIVTGYVGTKPIDLQGGEEAIPPVRGRYPTTINGVTVHRLDLVDDDMRGTLSIGEIERDVPFAVRRFFLVYDVPSREVRGAHAHRRLHQFLVCTRGRCSIVADDGRNRQEFVLSEPSLGLYLPPGIWAVQYRYTHEAVLLVLASEPYDQADYIRDYDEFRAFVGITD
jgi:UDP-2-acetamido-3-amino-2,3-dideoxy-glucuronate N-acetyltransferase